MGARDVDPMNPRSPEAAARVAAIDWPRVETELDEHGAAVIDRLLAPDECRALAALYDDDAPFRSRVVMARHGFGQGEYRYFRYPLPTWVDALRGTLYPRLAPLANRWHQAMGLDAQFPAA